MELSAADRIWNRAAQGEDSEEHRLDAWVGDRALRAVLLAHGMVMNGGVFHCVFEALSESELRAAADGYAYFGLDAAAATLLAAVATEDPWSESQNGVSLGFDARYVAAIPTELTIVDRFECRLAKHPEDFAPVGR